MSVEPSKFGMLKNLSQAASEKIQQQDSRKAESQESRADEQQENRKAEKQNVIEATPTPGLRHYSTYMPAELYAQLQIYVARQKAVRGKGQPSVSIQNVITEAVRAHLAQHDR